MLGFGPVVGLSLSFRNLFVRFGSAWVLVDLLKPCGLVEGRSLVDPLKCLGWVFAAALSDRLVEALRTRLCFPSQASILTLGHAPVETLWTC